MASRLKSRSDCLDSARTTPEPSPRLLPRPVFGSPQRGLSSSAVDADRYPRHRVRMIEIAAAEQGSVRIRRLTDMPVVAYGAVEGYGPIFNAGAIEVDGVFHLFARGVRDGYVQNAGEGPRFLS